MPGVVLVGLLSLFGSTGRDDVFISYWPARTLAEHGKLVNYNGEAVEQSSSLLLVLLLAVLRLITRLPFELLGILVSVSAGIALAWAVSRLAEHARGTSRSCAPRCRPPEITRARNPQ